MFAIITVISFLTGHFYAGFIFLCMSMILDD